jgi:hypothetical protein
MFVLRTEIVTIFGSEMVYYGNKFNIFLRFQVVLWINQNFLLLEEIEAVNGQLDVAFQSLRTHTPLVIRMQQNGNVCDFAVSVLNRSS